MEYLRPPGHGDEVVLVPYDDSWPAAYAEQEQVIRSALDPVPLDLQHVGSTSVPGLTAKPVIDILLVVPDPTDEPAYVPALEARGLVLHLRQPEMEEHRLLRRDLPRVNLHVFGPGGVEAGRMLTFRDHLRCHDDDRALYQRTKQALAARSWRTVQDYADAKDDVVSEIMTRAVRR